MCRMCERPGGRIGGYGYAVAAGITALSVALATPTAGAETLYAPVGGRSIRIGADRVLCPDTAGTGGWTIDADGHGVRPPTGDDNVGRVTAIRVAADSAQCATATATVALIAGGAQGAQHRQHHPECRRRRRASARTWPETARGTTLLERIGTRRQ